MLLSVIIPNYNHAPYLKERIDSVLQQNYDDFEVIILDDKSTDNSRDIIEQYRNHPKISHIIYNHINSGSTFKQWNKGVQLANGNYIWIAESDDVAEPDFIKSILPKLTENKTCVLAYCQSYRLNEYSEITGSWQNWTDDLSKSQFLQSFYCAGKEFIQKFLINKNIIPNASAVIFKKNTYLECGGVNLAMKLNGDWDLYHKLLLLGDVYFEKTPLNYFRQHSLKGSIKNIRNFNNINEWYLIIQQSLHNNILDTTSAESVLSKIQHIFYNQIREFGILKSFKNWIRIIPLASSVDKKFFKRWISRT